ncbi:MAG: hypothetical protein SGPRY_008357 [Prymnesium sp.]
MRQLWSHKRTRHLRRLLHYRLALSRLSFFAASRHRLISSVLLGLANARHLSLRRAVEGWVEWLRSVGISLQLEISALNAFAARALGRVRAAFEAWLRT